MNDAYACTMANVSMLQHLYSVVQAYLHQLAAIHWHTVMDSSYHNLDFNVVFQDYISHQASSALCEIALFVR